MHILIATLYAIIIWLSLMAYTAIVGGFWLVGLIAGPVIISALVVGLIAADVLVARIQTRFGRPVVEPTKPVAN